MVGSRRKQLRTGSHVCMYVCTVSKSLVLFTRPNPRPVVRATFVHYAYNTNCKITTYVTEPSGMVDDGSAMKMLLPLTLMKEY